MGRWLVGGMVPYADKPPSNLRRRWSAVSPSGRPPRLGSLAFQTSARAIRCTLSANACRPALVAIADEGWSRVLRSANVQVCTAPACLSQQYWNTPSSTKSDLAWVFRPPRGFRTAAGFFFDRDNRPEPSRGASHAHRRVTSRVAASPEHTPPRLCTRSALRRRGRRCVGE